jgi:M3 family oligoendopeptidase
MPQLNFHDFEVPTPTYDDVAGEHKRFRGDLAAAADAEAAERVVLEWDALRRRLDTWGALVHLRFNQDTTNAEYKAAREYCDQLSPRIQDLDVQLKRLLLDSPLRPALAERIGTLAFELWEVDVLAFDPAIQDDLVAESELEARYGELCGAAQFEFRGETCNLSEITKYLQDADRELRHDADRVRWQWCADNGDALDGIFDEQVRLRTKMAQKLGFDNFIGLAYKRMSRIDYGQEDVERFRAGVREHIVPLGEAIHREQAELLGFPYEELREWDEQIFDPAGNPKPQGDHDWMIGRAQQMFDDLGGGLDDFFRMMVDADLLDLKNRQGKAPGGFCTSFPIYGAPYIFANFNGTKGDVEVFTHEMGHAFQCYMSRDKPLCEYLWPTYESCEIHSMSLEFLTHPQMELFFGDGAERFRRIHLIQSLTLISYIVAVDHFQHLVYAQPAATPDERHGMWLAMERTYLPWRNYGDLAWPAKGGRWQLQRHLYLNPFYYIDYGLAQTCALQFWVRSRQDPAAALADYVALCRRGGEAAFRTLAKSAGLKSPFEPDCLSEVVEQARDVLGV